VFALLDKTFTVSDEGAISDYLGQPQLIASIISDCGLDKPKNTYEDGEPWLDQKWKYRSVIGKLNFLEKSTRPDIAYAVHQCARFTANPKLSHAEAVKNIVRYLKGTSNLGILLNPREQSLECYADASLVVNGIEQQLVVIHQQRNQELVT
jgi:hypothetical protein